jgi:hypothetical protein
MVIALAALPFRSADLKVVAVWVLLLSAIAALAISLYFPAGSQLACIVVVVCGYLVVRNRNAAYLLP